MTGTVHADYPLREPDKVKAGRINAMESHPGAVGRN